eukprot:CAMPEP_0183580768 /NCGR_PEP_ID=MMETSP0371-20130417/146323_1 /TAXON_ID=268820 /ORGANISM="Peridinium aciculiferum, Strain PAER-2" /LENGTH=33 /DNA_ID= /DNA_START= /DNA_END= /DNA_ORIENTATION=
MASSPSPPQKSHADAPLRTQRGKGGRISRQAAG